MNLSLGRSFYTFLVFWRGERWKKTESGDSFDEAQDSDHSVGEAASNPINLKNVTDLQKYRRPVPLDLFAACEEKIIKHQFLPRFFKRPAIQSSFFLDNFSKKKNSYFYFFSWLTFFSYLFLYNNFLFSKK